jgi:hopanoid biosynthesis associated protein HpnK
VAARLIINADDFGLTPGINRAIEELNDAGVLTSATLMANGLAFEDAIAIASTRPNLGVGCHVVLTDGVPVSPPESIPTLLGSDGRSFRPSLREFVQALLLGRIRQEDITREALAQIQKLQRAGIRITHFDTHKHTHLFPQVARPLLAVAEQTGIHAVRNPFEPRWSRALAHGSSSRRATIAAISLLHPSFQAHGQLRNSGVATTQGTLAISATGNLTETTLAQILGAFPAEGAYELCCHPGYSDASLERITTKLRAHRDIEREALLSVIPRYTSTPRLIHYGDLH